MRANHVQNGIESRQNRIHSRSDRSNPAIQRQNELYPLCLTRNGRHTRQIRPTWQSERVQTRLKLASPSAVPTVFSIPRNNQFEKKFCPAYWQTRAELHRSAPPCAYHESGTVQDLEGRQINRPDTRIADPLTGSNKSSHG